MVFTENERTTGRSWRPERQTAVKTAASDSSRSMTTPGRERRPRWRHACRAPGRRGSRPCPAVDSNRTTTAASSLRSAEVCTHSASRDCCWKVGYVVSDDYSNRTCINRKLDALTRRLQAKYGIVWYCRV